MTGIFERGGLTEDLRYPSALMRMMRGTNWTQCRGTKREYGLKPLKHSFVKLILVFKG